jgi:hypothetical protein
MQDLENHNMNALQEAQALYQEWRQGAERDGQASILVYLLSQRFGEVPLEVAEHIEHASGDTLKRWAGRVLTAQSLDDVFA